MNDTKRLGQLTREEAREIIKKLDPEQRKALLEFIRQMRGGQT